MDATFGTNSAGMSLFSVLAEVDGCGIPLAYCFVQVIPTSSGPTPRPQAGAMGQLLVQFLRPLQVAGLNPSFFNTDKDFAEIGAVNDVWPDTKHQLCLWHAKRAIRAKLKDATHSKTQASYKPTDALEAVPGLEICWGSLPDLRPNSHRGDEECQCPSRSVSFVDKGRLEPSTTAEQNTVVDLFTRHFNAHTAIPDRNGTRRSRETIYRECCSEMYQWCKQRGYIRLWAYLFVNWYRPKMWKLWARSENPDEIPVLKTTMVMESHWRLLKHDYLHRFNRPRIDLVIWILITRVIPDSRDRLAALRCGGSRMFKGSWRKAFKSEWKKLALVEVDDTRHEFYHTDPIAWTCGCDSYLFSRFLLCKHLVHCFENVPSGPEAASFFANIRRYRTTPFWRVPQGFILLPQHQPNTSTELTTSESALNHELEADLGENPPDSDSDSDSERESEIDDMEEEVSELQPETESDDEYCADVRWYNDLLERERLKGNVKFISYMKNCKLPGLGIKALKQDVEAMDSSRSSLTTWGRRKHPASLYLQ